MNPILSSLKSRLAWYEKALAMFCGSIPYENGFDWPQAPGIACPPSPSRDWHDMYIMYLSGCIHELHNTIGMMNARED
jgi:hypothetical protein